MLIGSCIDPFVPETASYDRVLYIECLLNNDTSQVQKVRISRATPVISSSGTNSIVQQENVSGALVVINENNEKSYNFKEDKPGHYLAGPEFQPQSGYAYQLVVNFEGNTFESAEIIMKEGHPIDRITFKHTREKVSETSPVYDGYHFYASTHSDSEDPLYFRWQSDITYFFKAYFDATHIWDGRAQIPASNADVKWCWASNTVKGIYVANTEGLAENRISEAPLHFQSQYGDALSIRYSLNLKQYSISREAFLFWNDMGRMVNQNGGMYDTQPYRIEGNIRCVNDPGVFVTGIFEAAGFSEKRIYVKKPTEFEVFPVTCTKDTIGTRDLPWYRIPRGSYIILDYASGQYFYSSPQCFDCTLKNGTVERPAFWEDGN
jgi:hypothetical protein